MKQTLIKLSDTYYIVVDDSEIKGGEWVYNSHKVDFAPQIYEIPKHPIEDKRWDIDELLTTKKITHSTQPLEEIYGYGEKSIDVPLYTIKGFNTIKQLSLSEVDEVINGYCVNKLFLKWESENGNCYNNEDSAFEAGFKAHQELVKDKLFTIEDMKQMFQEGVLLPNKEIINWEINFNNLIENKHPKNEWEVEFDEQGKIRLL